LFDRVVSRFEYGFGSHNSMGRGIYFEVGVDVHVHVAIDVILNVIIVVIIVSERYPSDIITMIVVVVGQTVCIDIVQIEALSVDLSSN
jgi:hypothetical protein